jgi:hypothetical protein
MVITFDIIGRLGMMRAFINVCIISVIVLSFPATICAQETETDKVVKLDGSIVEGEILRVSDTSVEIDPIGDLPFILIPRSEVLSLVYSTGDVVVINEVTKKSEIEREVPLISIEDFKPDSIVRYPKMKRRGIQFHVNFGLSQPTSPSEFTDLWHGGQNWGFGVSFEPEFFLPIMIGMNYSRFPFERDYHCTHGDCEISTYLISMSDIVELRYFFFRFGWGILLERFEGGQVEGIYIDEETSASYTLLFGLGPQYSFTRFLSVYLDLGYVFNIKSDGIQYFTAKIGLTLGKNKWR